MLMGIWRSWWLVGVGKENSSLLPKLRSCMLLIERPVYLSLLLAMAGRGEVLLDVTDVPMKSNKRIARLHLFGNRDCHCH